MNGRAVSSARQAHLVLVAVDGEIRNCVIAAVERACQFVAVFTNRIESLCLTAVDLPLGGFGRINIVPEFVVRT